MNSSSMDAPVSTPCQSPLPPLPWEVHPLVELLHDDPPPHVVE